MQFDFLAGATGTLAYFTSVQDWLIVGVVVMVLFGGSKIPEFAKGLGTGIREFKDSMEGRSDSEEKSSTPEPDTAEKSASAVKPTETAHGEQDK